MTTFRCQEIDFGSNWFLIEIKYAVFFFISAKDEKTLFAWIYPPLRLSMEPQAFSRVFGLTVFFTE
jgi:hypothetical protein